MTEGSLRVAQFAVRLLTWQSVILSVTLSPESCTFTVRCYGFAVWSSVWQDEGRSHFTSPALFTVHYSSFLRRHETSHALASTCKSHSLIQALRRLAQGDCLLCPFYFASPLVSRPEQDSALLFFSLSFISCSVNFKVVGCWMPDNPPPSTTHRRLRRHLVSAWQETSAVWASGGHEKASRE